MSDHRDGPETVSQVRAEIDAGQTKDKVDYPDPAAAPLGTDAEAGGNAPKARDSRRQPVWWRSTQWSAADGYIYPLVALPVAIGYLVIVWLAG